MSVRHAAVLEKTLLVKTLRSALESYKFQLRTITAFFIISGDSGQIPLELWPSWRREEDIFPLSHGASRPNGSEEQSVVRSCLPPGGFICACHFGAARHAAWDVSFLEDHSLGLPRLLGRLSGGTSLRLRLPRDALNLRLLLLRRRALKPSSWTCFYAPEEIARSPEGVFRG